MTHPICSLIQLRGLRAHTKSSKHTIPHILAIIFLYTNILIPKIALFGLPLNKVVFLGLAISSLPSISYFLSINSRTLRYISTCTLGMVTLASIGLYYGNEISDIVDFITFLPLLLAIPIFTTLISDRGIQPYLAHIRYAVLLLAIATISLYLYMAQFPSWNPIAYQINDALQFGVQITYREMGPQISTVMSGWIPVAFFLAYVDVLQRKSIGFRIPEMVILLLALLIHMSVGLLICIPASFIIFSFLPSGIRQPKPLLVLLTTIIVTLPLIAPDDLIDQKSSSINQKANQSAHAISLFLNQPIFGLGLGHAYTPREIPSVSGSKNTTIESTYPMILSSTGIIGLVVYGYIFLAPIYSLYIGRPYSPETCILSTAYAIVLIEAIGNPYLWGGGLGLLLLCLLAATIEFRPINITRITTE